MSERELTLARAGFEAWRRGDFAAVEQLVDPAATWRWFERGEWDCSDRAEIMSTLRERHAQGFAEGQLEFIDAGPDRVVLVSHPSRIGGEDWPDETATVLSFREGKVVQMQDYRTTGDALAAAQAT